MADALSIFPMNGNQETTQESTYEKEIVSEIKNIEELPEIIVPISLQLFYQYQLKDPILMAKYHKNIYKTGSFRGRSNINI